MTHTYSATDIVLIITAIGGLLTSLVAAIGAVLNNIKSARNAAKLDDIKVTAEDAKRNLVSVASDLDAKQTTNLTAQTTEIKSTIHATNGVAEKFTALQAENAQQRLMLERQQHTIDKLLMMQAGAAPVVQQTTDPAQTAATVRVAESIEHLGPAKE